MEVYPLTVLLQVLLNSLNRHFRYGFEMNERANCMQFTKQNFKVHSYDYLPGELFCYFILFETREPKEKKHRRRENQVSAMFPSLSSLRITIMCYETQHLVKPGKGKPGKGKPGKGKPG